MKSKRIISKLEIKGPNLVKGVNLEGMRVLGKPEEFSKLYYENCIDEIYYQDTVASLYGRNTLYNLIEKVSKEIFIPLCVGGGIKNLKDIYKLMKVGADKVSINKQALKNKNFIYEATKKFGRANICISIEAIKVNGNYFCFYDNGRNSSGVNVIEWISELDKIGVGEICITFVDGDGTGKGFDLKFINQIEKITNLPIVIGGGCGNIHQISNLFLNTKIDGISISSIFHYYYSDRIYVNSKQNYKSEGNIEFLKNDHKINKNIEVNSIQSLKKQLLKKGILCRI